MSKNHPDSLRTAAPDAAELGRRAQRYAALELVTTPVWIFDIDRKRVHWANGASLKVWKAPDLAELCSRDMAVDMSDSVARRLSQDQSDFLASRAAFSEQWTLYPGGEPVSLTIRYTGHRLDDGRMATLCEATPTGQLAPESLRSVEALLHTAVMITLYAVDGRPLYRNPAARAAVAQSDETLAQRVGDLAALERLEATLAADGVATLTLAVRTPQGERWHELSARRCRDAVTGQDAVLVSEADISAVKRTEERANFLALHDALTGLPNRSHVMQRFDNAMAEIRTAGKEAALIFIDLDHFKDVNDTLGHAAGDQLLVQVAQRLRHATRSSDLVARLGGDEFLILMVSADIRAEVDRVRERLLRTVAEPVLIHGTEVRVTPSAGVALYPRDGQDIETLLRNADLAMYTAKERGRNDLAYYDAAMAEAVRSRTELDAELRRALERNEFEVFYQPRVSVASGRIVGAEALLRWRHPERGLVMPDVFIPLCESSGLIRPLGQWVFANAARQQAAWAAAGHALSVSVNLSARQFTHPDLLGDLAQALGAAGCEPSRIEVEITESLLLGRDAGTLDVLRGIQSMGMSIALDDFGTGYSNLAYLQRFPIRTLKIDRSFIQGLDANRPLAELIVSMCRVMNLLAVAEGVETPEQLAWVASREIGQYQGYLFARPLPLAAFDELLAAGR